MYEFMYDIIVVSNIFDGIPHTYTWNVLSTTGGTRTSYEYVYEASIYRVLTGRSLSL